MCSPMQIWLKWQVLKLKQEEFFAGCALAYAFETRPQTLMKRHGPPKRSVKARTVNANSISSIPKLS
jgi:hypothetical protein